MTILRLSLHATVLLALLYPALGSAQREIESTAPRKDRLQGTQLQLGNVPQPPTLISPPTGTTVSRAATSTVVVEFVWQAATSGPPPEYYIMHMEEAGNASGYKPGFPKIPHPITMPVKFKASLPREFAGKTITWTVSACRGTQPPYCARQPTSRLLTWSTAVAPPNLLSPAHGATATSLAPSFSWGPVIGFGVRSYLLCASRSGVACPTQPTSNNSSSVVIRVAGERAGTATLDLRQFDGQSVNWTVASCTSDTTCVYQPQFRTITVPSLPPAPQLLTPADRTDENNPAIPYSSFGWTQSSGASHYLVCLRQSQYRCPEQEPRQHQSGMLVFRVNGLSVPLGSYSPRAELIRTYLGFGKSAQWTVAACNSYGCRYQPAERTYTFNWRDKPLLTSPLADFRVEPGLRGTSVFYGMPPFAWQPARGAARYVLCFGEAGFDRRNDYCLQTTRTSCEPSFAPPLGTTVWTVSACADVTAPHCEVSASRTIRLAPTDWSPIDISQINPDEYVRDPTRGWPTVPWECASR